MRAFVLNRKIYNGSDFCKMMRTNLLRMARSGLTALALTGLTLGAGCIGKSDHNTSYCNEKEKTQDSNPYENMSPQEREAMADPKLIRDYFGWFEDFRNQDGKKR